MVLTVRFMYICYLFHPQNVTVWLGGLFNPEAYVTATCQCVAQANSWSLEELCLEVSIADFEGQVTAAGGFNIKGKFEILVVLQFSFLSIRYQ